MSVALMCSFWAIVASVSPLATTWVFASAMPAAPTMQKAKNVVAKVRINGSSFNAYEVS
jgi:hypothetical protein